MTDPTPRREAVEAAAKAIFEDDESHLSPQRRDPWESMAEESKATYRENARAAIAAFLKAEGFEVERRGPIVGPRTEERIVGPWRPLPTPTDPKEGERS
jgi:hypothetical protein